MAFWILVILGIAIVVAAAFAIASGNPASKARAERRRRFQIDETGERIPMAVEHAAEAPPASVAEVPVSSVPYRGRPGEPASENGDSSLGPNLIQNPESGASATSSGPQLDQYGDPVKPEPPPLGRLIRTLDGERILTMPPFALRERLFSSKGGRWVTTLYRKLPPWVVICPKVRLDGLVFPTSPKGRDAEDWRIWRQRVRVRAVDFVLADRRTWKPILAVMIDHAARREAAEPRALMIGGGRDRIIDEVLLTVGLPLVRAGGNFHEDWPLIEPYVQQAILATEAGQESPADEASRAKPEAAVNLLRMDESRGWLLE